MEIKKKNIKNKEVVTFSLNLENIHSWERKQTEDLKNKWKINGAIKFIKNNWISDHWIKEFSKIEYIIKNFDSDDFVKKYFESLIGELKKIEKLMKNYIKNDEKSELEKTLDILRKWMQYYNMNFSKTELLNISNFFETQKLKGIKKIKKNIKKILTKTELEEFNCLIWLIYLFPDIKREFLNAEANKSDIHFSTKLNLKNNKNKPDIRIGKKYYEITTTRKSKNLKISSPKKLKSDEKSRLKYKYVLKAIEKKQNTIYKVDYPMNLCIFQESEEYWGSDLCVFKGLKSLIKENYEFLTKDVFKKFKNIYIFDDITNKIIINWAIGIKLNKESIEEIKNWTIIDFEKNAFNDNCNFLNITETKKINDNE